MRDITAFQGQLSTNALWLVKVCIIALISVALGVGVVAVAGYFGDAGPLVAVAIPLAPLIVLAILVEPRLGPALVIASIPVGLTGVPIGILELQGVEVALAVAVALVSLRRLGSGWAPLSWSAELWWALALVTWALISLASATDHQAAIKTVGTLSYGLMFASLILAACRTMDDVRRLLFFLVVVSSAIVLHALLTVGELQALYGGSIVTGRAQGLFTHPNELGSFSALTALVAAGLTIGARTVSERVASFTFLAILATGLIMSLSRGAWMGAIAGAILLMIGLPQARRAVLIIMVPLIVGAAVGGAFSSSNPEISVVGERVESLTKATEQPYDDRPAIWSEGLRQVGADPLTGQGPGNFSIGSRRSASASLTVYSTHAHNLYLTIAAELGIPALLLFLGFIASLVVVGRRAFRCLKDRRKDAALVAGIGAALLSVAIHGLVDGTLVNPIKAAIMWGLVGLLLVARRSVVAGPRFGDSPEAT